jgi:hypothetical protein
LIEGGLLQAQILVEGSWIAVSALIIWYAWKWPKLEA